MKLKAIAAASLLALAAGGASAYSTNFGWDSATSTFTFGATGITSGSMGTDTFSIDSSTTTLVDALYNVTADISGSNLSFLSVTIGGQAFTIYGSGNRIGDFDGMVTTPTTVVVDWKATTWTNPNVAANYQGSAVLTPVPEPETYALMLAGLGVVGFIAKRRKLG